MSASTWTVPKLTASATVYYPAEAAAITETDITLGQITLTASKMAALVKMSTEVTEDSIVSIVDLVISDLAKELSKAEDDNLFNGVASGVNANGIEGTAGVIDTNVANVAAIDLGVLNSVVGGKSNVSGLSPEWYFHPSIFYGQIADVVTAAGGNRITDLENGQRPRLLGYPVNFVNVMRDSSYATTGGLLGVFGDLSVGCYFGDRRMLGFQILNELFSVNDQIGVICTQRIDEVVANPEVISTITIT